MTLSIPAHIEFEGPNAEHFRWNNLPPLLQVGQGLHVKTAPLTDFWQRTHYGFCRDDGHSLLARVSGDFSVTLFTQFSYQDQYDQCGLFIRINSDNWIKCSVEFEDDTHSRLGSVVTRKGWSDWATQDTPSAIDQMHYRMSRRGGNFLIEYSEKGNEWKQMRIAHLDECPDDLLVGPYACSPLGDGFHCNFPYLSFDYCKWSRVLGS